MPIWWQKMHAENVYKMTVIIFPVIFVCWLADWGWFTWPKLH